MAVSVEIEVSGADGLEPIIERAVRATLSQLKVKDASVSVALLDDADITKLNSQYLKLEHVTDVISFPLYEADERPVGDIYIGADQARRQAGESGISFEEEIARLAIHGTLHVLKYDHPEDESRTQSEMWQLQETILKGLT